MPRRPVRELPLSQLCGTGLSISGQGLLDRQVPIHKSQIRNCALLAHKVRLPLQSLIDGADCTFDESLEVS